MFQACRCDDDLCNKPSNTSFIFSHATTTTTTEATTSTTGPYSTTTKVVTTLLVHKIPLNVSTGVFRLSGGLKPGKFCQHVP